VYYSGYVPVLADSRLPSPGTPVPMIRENRLYQTDWLLRFYKFSLHEVLNAQNPQLDLDIDPKLSWALRNLEQFPVDLNKADYEMILRVPGIGINSALKIVAARRFKTLDLKDLRALGVAFNRAKHFVCTADNRPRDVVAATLRQQILQQSKYHTTLTPQMSLFS
jgi:predicted DNA-binding helix-hairpin-helix protein